MKKIIITGISIFLFFSTVGILINLHINSTTEEYIYHDPQKIPESYTALVLGAAVYRSGRPSGVLTDRLEKAIELYKKNIIKRILVSGDHGKKYYDEVNNMEKFLLSRGIPKKNLFLDHAGFNTYNSIERAKEIFQVRDMIIVTQEFHQPRSVYIARKKGIKAFGYIADERDYPKILFFRVREYFARIKSYFEVMLNLEAKFYGPEIPITGDSGLSRDQK